MNEKNFAKYSDGVPMPIVTLNRLVLAFGILIAIIFQETWITSVIFLIILPTTLFGRRFSLIFLVGKILFRRQIPTAEREDAGLQRFNNSIATTMLALAQIFFVLGQPALAWIFAGMVMLASGVALAGFCVGCYLYYQFKMHRYRMFGP